MLGAVVGKCRSRKICRIYLLAIILLPGEISNQEINLETYFRLHAGYNMSLIQDGIEGDVIVQLDINQTGHLRKAEILNAPDPRITKMVQGALLNMPKGQLIPVDQQENRQRLLILRYRMHYGSGPIDYHQKVNRLLVKKKYKQALKYADEAISENKYDAAMYTARANIYALSGNQDDALTDQEKAYRLGQQILQVIDVFVLGQSRTTRIRKKVMTSY